MTKDHALAIMLLAGLIDDVRKAEIHELPNGYWPEAYVERRKADPWWLITTGLGNIRIGWRKRVISIEWPEAIAIDGKMITVDSNITRYENGIHAWSFSQAVEWLTKLRQLHAKASPPTDGER